MKKFSNSGFTLVELMIAVAILGILAAVAIPAYTGYIRRSYVSEASASMASIKTSLESFYSLNKCYPSAGANPGAIPSANLMAWQTGSGFEAWGANTLGIRPDRYVRFQYQVFTPDDTSCANISSANTIAGTAVVNATTAGGGTACFGASSAAIVSSNGTLVDTNYSANNWYVILAQGDLDGDGGARSVVVGANDDNRILDCNVGE